MMRIWGSGQKLGGPIGGKKWGPIGGKKWGGPIGGKKRDPIIGGGRRFPRRNPAVPIYEMHPSLKLIKPNRISVADHPFEAIRKLAVALASESLIKFFSMGSRKFPRFSTSMVALAATSQNTKASVMKFLLYNRNCGFSFKKSYDVREAIVSVSNSVGSLSVAVLYYGAVYWLVFLDPLSEHSSVSDLRKQVKTAQEEVERMKHEQREDGKLAKEEIKQLKEEGRIMKGEVGAMKEDMDAMKEDLQASKSKTWLRWLTSFWK
ncbi:unnamed protein product [Microthlaspi erraticum]|uniref:Uncharacterized protein n=1 Tax=Microthlaspi erraticum TaxID=1685480 RepID=A0A6D2I3I0_9BRAS|nr:unnamed protein product [Microthlaspi erraticum]